MNRSRRAALNERYSAIVPGAVHSVVFKPSVVTGAR